MGRQQFHDLEFSYSSKEKKNPNTNTVNQILLFFPRGFSFSGILVPVPFLLTCKLVPKSHALFKVFCSDEYGIDEGQACSHVWYNFGIF